MANTQESLDQYSVMNPYLHLNLQPGKINSWESKNSKISLPYVKVPAKYSMTLTITTVFAEHYFVEHAHIGEHTKKVNGS